MHYFGGRRPRRRDRAMHTMVLEAFVGPRPVGLYGCHNDGDPANNRLTNLRWDTPASNTADKVMHGRDPQRNKTRCPRGHLLEAGNLTFSDQRVGKRSCRACNNAESLAKIRAKRGHLPIDVEEYADFKYNQYMNPPPSLPTLVRPPSNGVKTECVRGHALSGPNLLLKSCSGRRDFRNCRACGAAGYAVRRAAKRGVELDMQSEADARYEQLMNMGAA